LEYNGFISTLIERSEDLLLSDSTDDLNVTRLLLVLNTGFALVRDRILSWEDANDPRLRKSNLKKEIKKAGRANLAAPITINDQVFFEKFRRCNDWSYFRVPKKVSSRSLTAHNIVDSLREAEEIHLDGLELDAITRALRNSFAHGGVFPMSSAQAGQRLKPSAKHLHDTRQIDRIYFASKWTVTEDEKQVDRGRIVMEFGTEALRTFWEDWKAMILVDRQALDQLFRAA
jgi:hypothetical protein